MILLSRGVARVALTTALALSFSLTGGTPSRSDGSPGAPSTPTAPAATSDFDGDGLGDLAVGAWGERVGGVPQAGAVFVDYSRPGVPSAVVSQGSPGVPGVVERYEHFGGVLAAGDLNGDGFADLAIGDDQEAVGRKAYAGSVTVLLGSPAGLQLGSARLLTQDTPGVPGTAETSDDFGAALAIGDTDGDGRAELAVAAPEEKVAKVDGAGAVWVFPGTATGPSPAAVVWSQAAPGVPGTSESGDFFGSAVLLADVTGDGRADLVVGVDNEKAAGRTGILQLLPGSARGLTSVGSQVVTSPNRNFTDFGRLLAGGRLDGDRFADVVVGVPEANELRSGFPHGAIVTLPGSPTGLVTSATTVWSTTNAGVPCGGAAVAVGDVDGDGYDDVAVGSAFEDVGGVAGAGLVSLLRGSSAGLTALGAQVRSQALPGIPGAAAPLNFFGSTLAAYDRSGDGRADLLVGVQEATRSPAYAGRVIEIPGTASGLSTSGTAVTETSLGLGARRTGENFGAAVAH